MNLLKKDSFLSPVNQFSDLGVHTSQRGQVDRPSVWTSSCLSDVTYSLQFDKRQPGRVKQLGQAFSVSVEARTLLSSEEASECVFSVVIGAPSDEGWRRILKDPKKYVAKSIQKGVEVSWQKLD